MSEEWREREGTGKERDAVDENMLLVSCRVDFFLVRGIHLRDPI